MYIGRIDLARMVRTQGRGEVKIGDQVGETTKTANLDADNYHCGCLLFSLTVLTSH